MLESDGGEGAAGSPQPTNPAVWHLDDLDGSPNVPVG